LVVLKIPPAEPLAHRVNTAIAISGLGRTTIYKLLREGRLKSRMVAGRRLIDAASLRELITGAA
jgi:excisionase family DNA binding protein